MKWFSYMMFVVIWACSAESDFDIDRPSKPDFERRSYLEIRDCHSENNWEREQLMTHLIGTWQCLGIGQDPVNISDTCAMQIQLQLMNDHEAEIMTVDTQFSATWHIKGVDEPCVLDITPGSSNYFEGNITLCEDQLFLLFAEPQFAFFTTYMRIN